MWYHFAIENTKVNHAYYRYTVRYTTEPAPDDILLGDFNKRDED